ncbi:MAG: peptidylprolyl isomerase [Candidatus Aegiribacteria sp.]|nr:peptidylprolyl isomerase [Candidatus Aegiribacteria sp.]
MTVLVLASLIAGMIPVEKVVAVVGDGPILHSEVEELLSESGFPITGDYLADSRTPEYLDALEQLIEEQLLVHAAIDAGYYPTDAEIQVLVDEEMANLLDQFPTGSDTAREYRDYLSVILGNRMAAQTLLGSRVQVVLRDMPINPETFLISNAELVEDIVMPKHIGWIYMPVLPSGTDLDQAVDEMMQLRDRIINGGSFEELAIQWSDDGSAVNGGALGVFGPGEMTPAFEDAAFSLESGEISLPVITPFGVHIIRIDRIHDDGTIEASHILRIVSVDQMDIDTTMVAANALHDSILSNTGITFEQAARLYSLDRTSSEAGGDLGTVPLKLWLPVLAEAALLLEEGSVSEPVFLSEAGAVVLLKIYDDSGEIDWSTYTDAELSGIVQQVIYHDTYTTIIDSLRKDIPVIYYLNTDDDSAN